MRVQVNGTARELTEGTTVGEVVAATGAPQTGVAVALDGAVLPRARWSSPLREGSTVEVLTAVQGG